ncbi:MAG: DUF2189 domain-containing protein [Rhodospirillales bacterium]|nr:DUF2189 domain-containing protein [Rhodospirillales bacterium]
MTDTQFPQQTPAPPVNLLPYQNLINSVTVEDVFGWLAKGWHDFKAGGLVSLGYGLIFVVAALALTVGLFLAGFEYLIAPFLESFLFIGPALTVGFYAISRELEKGGKITLIGALSAWNRNTRSLLAFGLVLVIFMLIWMRLAVIIFALSFPFAPMELQPMINAVFFSVDGYVFLALGSTVGAVMATLVFMGSVVSLPIILDRGFGFGQALVISFVTVLTNFRPMMAWAAVIVVITGAGLFAGFIGLAVSLPLVGHASWHAYRGLIKPE